MFQHNNASHYVTSHFGKIQPKTGNTSLLNPRLMEMGHKCLVHDSMRGLYQWSTNCVLCNSVYSVMHSTKCSRNAKQSQFSGQEMSGLKIPLILLTQDNHKMQSYWRGCQWNWFLCCAQIWTNTLNCVLTSHFSFLFLYIWLSVCLSRSSPTPKAPWVWAAPSLRAALVSLPPCPQGRCHCTSTTPRSLTQDATSARSSFLIILASQTSSVWTWKVRNRFIQTNFTLPAL